MLCFVAGIDCVLKPLPTTPVAHYLIQISPQRVLSFTVLNAGNQRSPQVLIGGLNSQLEVLNHLLECPHTLQVSLMYCLAAVNASQLLTICHTKLMQAHIL
jgi:hypothetical protein